MAYAVRAAVVLATVGGLIAGGVAFAHGPSLGMAMFGAGGGGSGGGFQPFAPETHETFTPRRTHFEQDREDELRVSRRHRAPSGPAVSHRGGGPAVCVRLCDGFFFPATPGAGTDAACNAQCPDAPTALYSMTSDRIEDAVSLTGAPYTALPVAKRFETSSDATCTCHRDGFASRARQLLTDPTLRKGDVVMTADGFRVYEGGVGKSGAQAFVALNQAGDLPKDERASLAAMEKANAASPALAAPATLVARPKGNVTVDDGQPAPNP